MRLETCAILSILAVTGCGSTHYAVQYRVETKPVVAEAMSFPPTAAIRLLAAARAIAFAPPDFCDERAAGLGGDTTLLGGDCGAVMSALEDMAIAAGYEVASWRTLKGDQPAIRYARESKVDVLFEINRMKFRAQAADVEGRIDTEYAEIAGEGRERSISPATSTRERCLERIREEIPKVGADSLILDAKVVAVSDGRTLWHYHGLTSHASDELRALYYRPDDSASTAMVWGWVLAGVGTAALITGAAIPEKYTAISGAPLALAGGTLLVISTAWRSDPDNVLCEGPSVPPPGRRAVPGRAPTEAELATFSGKGRGDGSETLRVLTGLAARDFISVIAAVRTLNDKKPAPFTLASASAVQALPKSDTAGCLRMVEWHKQGKVDAGHVKAVCGM